MLTQRNLVHIASLQFGCNMVKVNSVEGSTILTNNNLTHNQAIRIRPIIIILPFSFLPSLPESPVFEMIYFKCSLDIKCMFSCRPQLLLHVPGTTSEWLFKLIYRPMQIFLQIVKRSFFILKYTFNSSGRSILNYN